PQYKTQKNARADYVDIAKDPDIAKGFLGQLSILQAVMVNCGVSCVVTMDIYNDVSPLLDLRKVVPPYALGARMCIERIHRWEEQFASIEPVECIFEEGDFEQGKFTDLMVDEGRDPPIYKKKEILLDSRPPITTHGSRHLFSRNMHTAAPRNLGQF
ncbi:MAG TPA: hypothetical protein VFC29_06550, partial [Candidatus Limnocylindrales bacterium]|nr:hypothetical protein [Candidatus Limnocylindrales bacterium]